MLFLCRSGAVDFERGAGRSVGAGSGDAGAGDHERPAAGDRGGRRSATAGRPTRRQGRFNIFNSQQECIPVGCVPSAAVAVSGGGGWSA